MLRKSGWCIALLLAMLIAGSAVVAEEEEGHEKKEKPPEKPRPDSAISTVLQLPEVKKWQQWIDSRNNGSSMTIWGEALKTVNGGQCWDVAVGITTADDTRILARFCVMALGLDIYVEGKPDAKDEITYYPYEVWRSQCKPTEFSGGKC